MVCFHPISAYYPLEANSDGKRYLKFGKNRYLLGVDSSQYVWMTEYFKGQSMYDSSIYDAPYDFPLYLDKNFDVHGLNIKVPCGKCIGCRLDYSRMWATRSANEAIMYNYFNDCSFVTLTFNNDMLNRRENPYSLNKSAFRCWIKRLRKAVKLKYNKEFRIMACGEYGSKHQRPHYHMIIYGFNFPDKKVWKYEKFKGREIIYYRSDFLEDIWRPAHSKESFGFSVIGEVNFESSAYVARYVTKKLFGPLAEKVYKSKEPEFLTTSRMPGLGYEYLKKYKKNIFELGYIMLPNGHKAPIPRYYSDKMKEIDNNLYNNWRVANFNKMIDNLFIENLDNTQQRLLCREELKKYNLGLLYRRYEFEEQ